MVKKKKFLLIIFLSILLICVFVMYKSKKDIVSTQSLNLSDNEKKNLNYNFEIPNNINVLSCLSENKIIALDDNKLKIYNLENNSFEKDIASINKNYKVKSLLPFDSGIIWCENQVKPTVKSKVYIKYFSSDNKPTLIDESDSDILPSLAVTSKYLTYYIVNSNKLNIKIFNLSNNENTTIESYKLGDFSDMPYISTPNSNNKDVIWSFSKKGKSKILKYNIAEKKISEFNKSDSLSNPVFKNNKILAVKNMNFEDKELNISYASDYIVEYDYTQKKWVKFLENEINKYIDAPQESVINLSTNEGLLYWD
ncbi:hypothetical protein QJR26_18930 (plasmid) [Clostridium baratii]